MLLWLIEADVFQMPQLHKHFNIVPKFMRLLIALIFLFSVQISYSQELDIFQNDSIYAKNKISSRTMYSINGSTLQKEIMTYYNSAGKKIKQFSLSFEDNGARIS